MFQSTHAHGVRQIFPLLLPTIRCFNPRTHTACDLLLIENIRIVTLFQSTHAHGVRLYLFLFLKRKFRFQSTHAHGVRQKVFDLDYFDRCFNPRTHTACDGFQPRHSRRNLCFNPRTHTACDNATGRRRINRRCFNPRTHTACDV